jgi:SAM-dependent methyltransferase
MRTRPTPAEEYQNYFAPAIFDPLARELLAFAPPRPGDRVLDVACGTGIVARAAAAAVGPSGQVVGVDVNPGMIDVATAQPGHDGVPIQFRQGDATALDLPDRSYDLVYCQQGLQFFANRPAALGHMHRVLDGGGRLAVAVWHGLDRHPLLAAVSEAELPHLSSFGVSVTREDLVAPFSLGDRNEVESLLADAGFRGIEFVSRTIETRFAADRFIERMEYAYAAVVPQFVADPDLFAAYLERISRDTTAIVERYRHDDWVVAPMHTHLAVAHA